MDQKLERDRNVTKEEEITKIDPIPSYFIYYGFEKDLYTAMVYKRLMDSTETSATHSHALIFLRSCMIGKWRLNDAKTLLTQSQFCGMPPPDTRRWSHSWFSQIFPTQYTGMAGKQCPIPTGTQQRPTNHHHIPPLKMNTAGIPVYQIDASEIQELLTKTITKAVGATQGSAQEIKIEEVRSEFKVAEVEKQIMKEIRGP